MGVIESVFGRSEALIGVVHLEPLPGSCGWKGDMAAVVSRALEDATAIEASGFDGIILENFGDAPFSRTFAGRGAVAAMSAVGALVAENTSLPLGINVLRSDALSAVAVAAAVGARFIRVNVHVGAAATDQGIIQGNARETLLAIAREAPGLRVFADVFVKHAKPLGSARGARARPRRRPGRPRGRGQRRDGGDRGRDASEVRCGHRGKLHYGGRTRSAPHRPGAGGCVREGGAGRAVALSPRRRRSA
jgi:hypothetical protein